MLDEARAWRGGGDDLLANLRQMERDAACTPTGQPNVAQAVRPLSARQKVTSSMETARALSGRPGSAIAGCSVLGQRANARTVEWTSAIEQTEEVPTIAAGPSIMAARLSVSQQSAWAGPTIGPSSPRSRGYGGHTSIWGRGISEGEMRQTYDRLVKGIDAAMASCIGGHSRPITLPIGESLPGKVDAFGGVLFAVPLPRWPVQVVLHIDEISGGHPSMYASVSDDRPSSKHFDLAAVQSGELIYRHDPEPEFGSNGAQPHLYIGVECEDACEFRLRCTSRRLHGLRVKVTTNATRLHKAKEHVENRLDELRSNPEVRKSFKMKVKALLQSRDRPEPFDKDFEAINQALLEESGPARKALRRKQRAAQRSDRQEDVLRRREDLEEEAQKRKEWWINKTVERQLLRLAEEKAKEESELLAQRRHLWLNRLATVTFLTRTMHRLLVEKADREELRRRLAACKKIQDFWLSYNTHRRMRFLYRNILTLRMAFTTACRLPQHVNIAAAQERIRWFLSVHCSASDVPDLLHVKRRFVHRVLLVQQAFWRMKRMRKARVEALLARFLAEELVTTFKAKTDIAVPAIHDDESDPDSPTVLQDPAAHRKSIASAPPSNKSQPKRSGSKSLPAATSPPRRSGSKSLPAAASPPKRSGSKSLPAATSPPKRSGSRSMQASSSSSGRKSSKQSPPSRKTGFPQPKGITRARSGPRPASVNAPAPSPQPPIVRQSSKQPRRTLRAASKTQKEPAFVRDFAGEELLPEFVRRMVLHAHVVEMQRSFPDRLKRWQERKKEVEIEDDIHRMGLGQDNSDARSGPKPRPIELNRLMDLYSSTYDGFLRGEYKYVIHRRKCMLKKVLHVWSIAVGGEGGRSGQMARIQSFRNGGRPRHLHLEERHSFRGSDGSGSSFMGFDKVMPHGAADTGSPRGLDRKLGTGWKPSFLMPDKLKEAVQAAAQACSDEDD